MKVNTLVKHKKFEHLGIVYVSKAFSKSVKVNFGSSAVMKCFVKDLEIVNTKDCKTVSFEEFRRRVISNKSILDYCIVGNELKHYVGIGWITKRVIREEDLKNFPRVI